MKERPNIAAEEDTEEMNKWRSLSQRKSWTSTKSKRAREEHLKAEVTLFYGEKYARTRNTELESGEKIVGQELSLFITQLAAFAKQAGGVNRRGGDEAAAKDGYHERSDKEDQIKRKDGC